MPAINFNRMRECLAEFQFQRLFIEALGWSRPASRQPAPLTVQGVTFTLRHVAQLAGVVVLEASADGGRIPDAKLRAAVHKEVTKQFHEHLLIFVDEARSQSLWYWVKRQDGKDHPRDHLFVKGQPGDLFLSKLGQMVFDFADLDESGNVPVVEVAGRLRKALDIERVTKKFYGEFYAQHLAFLELIRGVPDERKRRWYASVLLNRLMFVYFLQRKGFVNGGQLDYLQDNLRQSKQQGKDRYFRDFLTLLFFEGFAKPEDKRSPEAVARLGKVRYLNGGLFLRHQVETEYPDLNVPDRAFENLFALFQRYSWNLNDTPGGADDEINPDVLGYIFEKYINQKAFGAYYTRPEITDYLCEQTIHRLVLDAVNTQGFAGVAPARQFETVADLLLNLDVALCRKLLLEVLPRLSLLDPACGSGAFLVAAMKALINVYTAIVGKIKFLKDNTLNKWLADAEREHPSLSYFIKKTIITENLYGVDVMEEAAEIAKLRLFLALVASADSAEQLEPLPNIDFNILAGNSLVGLMRVESGDFEKHYEEKHPSKPAFQQQLFNNSRAVTQGNLFRKSYTDLLAEKNRLIDQYRHASTYADDLTALRDDIERKKGEAREALNDVLLEECQKLGIKFEEATWDAQENELGKPKKRPLAAKDIDNLHPFHWGYEFDEILQKRGGFDAIITNPPWETFKPNGKEFFEDHSELVSKKKMTIKEFEKEQAKLLNDQEIREAWLDYLSSFPHVSAYFRSVPQYRNQISIVNGKKAGTDINLYKLFVEQCYNLLRPGGRCGIITPGSVYTDLGAKRLREVLFDECQLDSLFGLSNEKYIFEGVHHSQKICILSFGKGGKTDEFTAAFRINPREAVRPEDLDRFLHDPSEHLTLSVALIRKLSPDSLSVMEFKTPQDIAIAQQLLRYPLLGQHLADSWNVRFGVEFHMTNDSHLFKTAPGKGRLPLYEGKMIHQFEHRVAEPKYWLNEREARAALLGKEKDKGQPLDYQSYRLGFRDVARNTDARTAIMTMLPGSVFCNHTLPTAIVTRAGHVGFDSRGGLLFCAIVNSLVADFVLRQRVTAHLTFFLLNQVPIPRITEDDPAFSPVVERAARLICTTPEFDELARAVGLNGHEDGVTDEAQRTHLRAELDGLIAHLYGLTEEEFAYILTTFPLVQQSAKEATLEAYRRFAPDPTDRQLAAVHH
jgi:hypothetical protein